jgi:hypothetical protein
MDEVAKEVVSSDVKMVVVEDLKKMNHRTKLRRRLSKICGGRSVHGRIVTG